MTRDIDPLAAWLAKSEGIGTTSSGKVVQGATHANYQAMHAIKLGPSEYGARHGIAVHETHPGFTAKDHHEAVRMHGAAKAASTVPHIRTMHQAAADGHLSAANLHERGFFGR